MRWYIISDHFFQFLRLFFEKCKNVITLPLVNMEFIIFISFTQQSYLKLVKVVLQIDQAKFYKTVHNIV